MKGKQLSLTDAALTFSLRTKTSETLRTLGALKELVDWYGLVKIVGVLDRESGRPPISFEIKLKMLFSRYTFNLSD
jgi:hypothetical protein